MFHNRNIRRLAVLGLGLCSAVGALPGDDLVVEAKRSDGFIFAEDLFPELRGLMLRSVDESPSLLVPALSVEQREQEARQARGENRPQARLFLRAVGHYQVREDIDDEFGGNVNANLTVTQNLYHWGAFARREALARKRVEAERLQYAEQSGRHFMQMRRVYLQWLLLGERRDILEKSIALNQSFVDARRQLVAVGQSSEQDVLEMEARLLENREALASVQSGLEMMESSLRQLVGQSFAADRMSRPSLAVIEPMGEREFADLRARVLGNSPARTLQGERLAVFEEMEADQMAILSKRTWPMLQLVAGAFTDTLEGINQQDSVWRVQYFAGLQVQWNIFDGWQTDALKRAALARKRTLALQGQQAQERARGEAEALLARIELNRKQIEARALRQNLLERRVELLREQAERDLVTGTDHIEGEINYLDVRQRLMEARVDYLMNLMELAQLLQWDPALSYPAPKL